MLDHLISVMLTKLFFYFFYEININKCFQFVVTVYGFVISNRPGGPSKHHSYGVNFLQFVSKFDSENDSII